MTDPRRAKIAEAMEARARWERRQQPSGIPYPTDAMAFTREATEALPVAAELIEELTAEVERLNERFSKLAEAVQIAIYADAIAEWQDEEGDGLKSVYREVTND